jgi:hypothetical protein
MTSSYHIFSQVLIPYTAQEAVSLIIKSSFVFLSSLATYADVLMLSSSEGSYPLFSHIYLKYSIIPN